MRKQMRKQGVTIEGRNDEVGVGDEVQVVDAFRVTATKPLVLATVLAVEPKGKLRIRVDRVIDDNGGLYRIPPGKARVVHAAGVRLIVHRWSDI